MFHFFGPQIGSKLNWETDIEYIIPKPSSACYAIRVVNIIYKN